MAKVCFQSRIGTSQVNLYCPWPESRHKSPEEHNSLSFPYNFDQLENEQYSLLISDICSGATHATQRTTLFSHRRMGPLRTPLRIYSAIEHIEYIMELSSSQCRPRDQPF
jgi:hypothetical protein